MGAPKIIVPPAPVLPSAPDQSSVSVQQFGAMFRRRAAAGYASTFPDQADKNGAPMPFHTDTIPGAGVGTTPGTDIVIDPATGLPTEVPHVSTAAEQAAQEAAATAAQAAEQRAAGVTPAMTPEEQAAAYRRYQNRQVRIDRANVGDRGVM